MSQAIFPGNAIVATGSTQGSVRFNTTHMNAGIGLGLGTGGTVASSVDTYIKESAITAPAINVGSTFRWSLVMSKTAAGIATTTFSVHAGTLGDTTDNVVVNFTLAAQTNVADTGWCEIMVTIGNLIAGSYNVQASLFFTHNLAATGLTNVQAQVSNSSVTRVLTPPLIFGISCNPGASAVWTFQQTVALGLNL